MEKTVQCESHHAPHRWRRLLVRFSLATAVFILLFELGLRFLGLGNPVIYVKDPDCGYLPASSQDVLRFFKQNYINTYGMRCPEVPPQKPPGVYRIMFVGDSVTYGTTFVDQKDIFTSILQRDLPGLLNRPVQVLNASAGGWASTNEAGYIRSRGTFESDLVVMVLNTGDLNQPFNAGALSLVSGYPDHNPPLAIWELWARYLAPRLLHRMTADAGSTADAAPQDTMESAKVLEALESARLHCVAKHARFAIMYVPSHGPGWDVPAYAAWLAKLQAWASNNGVVLLDAENDLSAVPRQVAYFDGIHLRPQGDAIIAHFIEKNWQALAFGPTTQPAQ